MNGHAQDVATGAALEDVIHFHREHVGNDSFDVDSLRGKIILSALEIAAAEGVQGASVRKIAAKAGMRFATLYSHFPQGKDELISEALLSSLRAFYGHIARSFLPDDSALHILRKIISAHVQWSLDKAVIADAFEVVKRADEISPLLSDDARSTLERLRGSYRTTLRALLEDLGVAEEHSAPVAQIMICICDDAARWGEQVSNAPTQLSVQEFGWFKIQQMIDLNRYREPTSYSPPWAATFLER